MTHVVVYCKHSKTFTILPITDISDDVEIGYSSLLSSVRTIVCKPFESSTLSYYSYYKRITESDIILGKLNYIIDEIKLLPRSKIENTATKCFGNSTLMSGKTFHRNILRFQNYCIHGFPFARSLE
uniref:Peptidase S1 domain-containing protein n=1 Tax=Heterorhabditis bacteriophora TaxID=37862 RepID=A0A1I7W9X9_HETBA